MKGFTLIETLIALTILGLVSGGGIVYMNRINAVQKIESTRLELVSNLRLASNMAVSNQTPVGIGDTLSHVLVTISNDGIMSIWANAVGVGNSYFSKDITTTGIGISMSPSNDIRFQVYSGRLLTTPDGSNLTLTVSSQELPPSNNKQVIINESGLINEN